jgi:hypothetical protein
LVEEVGDYVDGGTQGEGVMRALEVVPGEPNEETLVEGVKIVEEQVLLVVDELFLQRAIEAFAVGIHLRCARIGVPVSDVAGLKSLMEAIAELWAVIGEGSARRDGE